MNLLCHRSFNLLIIKKMEEFMKKLTFIKAFGLSIFLGLTACKEVKFNNGEVPEKYMDQAKGLEGSYNGQFNGRTGKLSILFQGNKPYLIFEGTDTKDIIGNQCDSQFGDLQTAYINNSKKLESVTFAFRPNNCVSVHGESITLLFNSDYTKIGARILLNQYMEKKCDYEFGGPGGGMREVCHYEPVDKYLTGKFRR